MNDIYCTCGGSGVSLHNIMTNIIVIIIIHSHRFYGT